MTVERGLHGVGVSRIGQLQLAISQLQGCSSLTEVWRLAAHSACTELGFARAVALRLQGSNLVVDGAHSQDDPTACSAQVGRTLAAAEIPLVEEIARTGDALLVPDARDDPRMSCLWPDGAPSRAFATAPMTIGPLTIGLLCADHHGTGRTLHVTDRDWLWSYAQAVGLALHRVELEERLRHVSRQARALLSIASVSRAPAAAHPTSSVRRVQREAEASAGPGALARLTPREHDVLRLMASGRSNAQIGNELLITRETVKSHVARLHRKLGVVNRTEAVALYERAAAASMVEIVL
jgi:DNA-binding CsgD family transcriptional regulator